MRGHSDLILVFINLLCSANQDGIIDRHWKAISDETGLSNDRVKAALLELEEPDIDSRSRNDDGRRIKRIDPERDWGWEIINYRYYRALRNEDERREYMRDFMRRKRAKKPVSNLLAELAHAEAEAEAEKNILKKFVKPTPEEVTEYAKNKGIILDGEVFCSFYESKGWVVGKTPMKDWKAAITGSWKHNNKNKGTQNGQQKSKRDREYPENITVPHL